MSAQESKDWKSAAEWAAVGLAGMPITKRNINALAGREQWETFGPAKARKRKGQGGGWEYHVTCLPDAAQADWAKRQRVAEAEQVVAVQTEVVVVVDMAPAAAITLRARQRRVMEARAVVLREVARRGYVEQTSQRAAIEQLIREYRRDHALMEFLRLTKAGEAVPVALLADYPDLQKALALDIGIAGDLLVLDRALFEAISNANDRSGEKQIGLSLRQVLAWKAAYASGGIHALAPKMTREKGVMKGEDIYPWLPLFLRHYCKPAKPTIEQSLANFRDNLPEGLKSPSYDQVCRALKALSGTKNFLAAFKGREGPLALKARLGFTRRTTDGMDPTTVYISDGKTFDAYVQHPIHGRPFRPEITPVLDVVTRKCVGWSVGLAETALGVADALRHACQTHGIPAIFYSDRGPGFRNDLIDQATIGMCARLGTTTSHSLPYNSQARGIIERAHGTIWNRLAKEFPTYQGADADREASQKRFKAISKDIKEFGTSALLPTWEFFLEQVEMAIQIYNSTAHSSLRLRSPVTGRMSNVSPTEYWESFVANGFEPVPLPEAEADDLFRPHFKRVSERGEVRWNNNHYYHHDLQPFDGKEVLIGIDIHDARRVWVRRIDMVNGEEQPGALICVADFYGNKSRYMPHSYEAKAIEKRGKDRLQRIDVKKVEVIEEMRGAMLLDAQVLHMPEFEVRSPAAALATKSMPRPITEAKPANVIDITPSEQRPKIKLHPDVELAMESLADPSSLTPNRIRLLEEFIGHRPGQELLRLAGVDLGALRALLWSAA